MGQLTLGNWQAHQFSLMGHRPMPYNLASPVEQIAVLCLLGFTFFMALLKYGLDLCPKSKSPAFCCGHATQNLSGSLLPLEGLGLSEEQCLWRPAASRNLVSADCPEPRWHVVQEGPQELFNR